MLSDNKVKELYTLLTGCTGCSGRGRVSIVSGLGAKRLTTCSRCNGGAVDRKREKALEQLLEHLGQKLEDESDIAAASQALAEPGDSLSLEQLKQHLDERKSEG